MPSPDYDLRYLRAGLQELKPYLLSHEIFWPLGLASPRAEPPYPQMTLGNLLLSRARLRGQLEAGQLENTQRQELHNVETEYKAMRQEWRSAWESKERREFGSRLRQWKHTLDEIDAERPNYAGYYANQIRLRAIIELLAAESGGQASEEMAALRLLDARLQAISIKAKFVWEQEVEAGFDREKYWFLFRAVK